MRAGFYAVIDGTWVQSRSSGYAADAVVLTRPARFDRPEGAKLRGGEWRWTVPRSTVEREIQVDTSGVWRGLSVAVVSVDGELAHVESRGTWSGPVPAFAEQDSPDKDGWWRAHVLVRALADVREQSVVLWP